MKGRRFAVWGAIALVFLGCFLLVRFESKSVVLSNLGWSDSPIEAVPASELTFVFAPPRDFSVAALGLSNPGPSDIACQATLRNESGGAILDQRRLVLKKETIGPVEIRFPRKLPAGGRFSLIVRSQTEQFRVMGTGQPFADSSVQTLVDGRPAFGTVCFEISSPEKSSLLRVLKTRTPPRLRWWAVFLVAVMLACAASIGRSLVKWIPDRPPASGWPSDPGQRNRIILAAALFVFALTSLGFLAPNNTRVSLLGSEDDAFITYRYARNIDQGLGFRFNADEKCLGTTTPLYTLLLAGLGLVSRDLPLLSLIVGFLSILFSALLVSNFLAEILPPAWATVGGVQFVLFPFWYRVLGMETNFLVFLLIAALAAFHRRKYCLSFFVLGLAILTRFESILLLFLFGGALLLRKERKKIVPALGVLLAVVLPWFVFAHFYFGRLLPNTFYVKAAVGGSGTGIGGMIVGVVQSLFKGSFLKSYFLTGFSSYLPSEIQSYSLWVAIFAISAVLSFRRILKIDFLRLYMLWTLAYVLGFALLNVPRFVWYYVLAFSVFPILIPLGARVLPGRIRARRKGVWAAGALVLLAGFPLVLGALNIQEMSFGRWYERHIPLLERHRTYEEAAAFIEHNLPPGRSIAVEEIGVLGYATSSKIWDLYGLVHDATRFPLHFPNSPGRIPFFLTLMSPDYLFLISHRLGEQITYRNFTRIKEFPVVPESAAYPTAYTLLQKPPDRLIAFGDVHAGGPFRGRAVITGWCMADEEIEAVSIVQDGRNIAEVAGLVDSPDEIRDFYGANRYAARAVFHLPFDTAGLGPGTHEVEFWASNGGKKGIFWKGPIRIE